MNDDDNDDLAGQYGGQPQDDAGQPPAPPGSQDGPAPFVQQPVPQQAPPPIPEPFTTADSMRLQKLQAGLAQAQEQVDDGTLHPEEGRQLAQAITAMMVPLALRQKRAKQQAMQEQAGDLMQRSAQMGTIEHANAGYRAKGFQDRVATYTDPLTGRTAHMVEAGNGKWQEIKFDGDPQSQDDGPTFQGQANGYYPLASAVGYEDPANPWSQLQTDAAGNVRPNAPGMDGQPGDLPRDTGPPVPPPDLPRDTGPAGEQPPAEGQGPAGQRIDPAPDGGHVMTIQNGQRVEKWKFGADGSTTKVYDSAQQQQQGQANIKDFVQPHEVQTLTQRAAESLKQFMPQPQQFPGTAAGRVAYGNALAHWQGRVAMTAAGWVNNLARGRQQQAAQGAIAQRQDTNNASKEQRLQERLAAQKGIKAQQDQDGKDLRHHVSEISKEPDWMGKPYADRLKEAQGRMRQERDALGVQPPGGDANAGGANPPPTDPRQRQIAELDAHLNRNVSGQAAPGAPPPNAPPAAPAVLNAQAAGADTVQPLHAAVAKELGGTSFWSFGRRATLRDMYGVLMKAQAEGRGPSVAERAEYERLARGIGDPDAQQRLLAPFGGK